MPVATVELIMFGIQAGLQLAQAGRRVYVETTIAGDVDIPLPTAVSASTLDRAIRYANSLLNGSAQEKARFKSDYKSALDAAGDGKTPDSLQARWELVSRYVQDVRDGLVPDFAASFAPMIAVLAVRQFAPGKSPFPNPVQRVAGTLIDIAVDYFATVPGALSEHSRQGKALRQFLLGLSDVDFADARVDQIVVALFSAALDTLKDNPQLIVEDKDDEALVTKIVGGVVQDVHDRLKASDLGDLDVEDRLKQYSKVVLRSLLKNAGQAIVDDPSVLGLKRGNQVLVQSVGSAFLELLLGKDEDDSLADGLRRIASTKGLDQLVAAALKAVVEHPEFFRETGNPAVDKWITDVLRGLYDRAAEGQSFFEDPALFADVAYMAIDYGLRDLPVLLKTGTNTAGLLTDVARKVFDVLVAPPAAGQKPRWKLLNLSRSDLKDLFESVFVSVVMHNEWLIRRQDVQKSALAVVPLVIEALCGLIDGDGVGHLKPLLRSGHLHEVIAAVLASEVIKPTSPPDAQDITDGIKALLDELWASGATGGERLLDEDVLLDLLIALSRSGAAQKLFGGKTADVQQVVDLLLPILTRLRQGETIPIDLMVTALKVKP